MTLFDIHVALCRKTNDLWGDPFMMDGDHVFEGMQLNEVNALLEPYAFSHNRIPAEELASIISSFEIIETMLEENNTQISISEEIEQLKALAANPESFDSEQEKKREEAYLKEASDLFAADQMLRDNAHQRRVDLQNQESDDEENAPTYTFDDFDYGYIPQKMRTHGRCTDCECGDRDLVIVSDDSWVCLDCIEDHYQKCDICGEFWDTNWVEFVYTKDDRLVCPDCAETLNDDEIAEMD